MKEADTLEVKVFNVDTQEVEKSNMNNIIEEILMSLDISFFNIEAIKAHAIMIRTYLVKKMRFFGGSGVKFHFCDITNKENEYIIKSNKEIKEKYGDSYDEVNKIMKRAIDETKNKIIIMNNKPIYPRFHETCGGATENSEMVGVNKIMYLRKVLCEYCTKSPYYEEYVEISTDELINKLDIAIDESNPLKSAEIEGIIYEPIRDKSGRITSIKVGHKEIKGSELVEKLSLNSTRFGWKPVGFKIYTRGKGHGLGLCQYGANEMALNHIDSEEIIKYYFTGVKFTEIEIPNKEKPLYNKIIVIDPGHGGECSEDNVGKLGNREKDINLQIGLKLKTKLEELGAKVIITREKDEYVSLSKRASMSNEVMPHFFLSIHQNSFMNSKIYGSEIYIYRGDEESKNLAQTILKHISDNMDTVTRGVKTADFYLLREVHSSALQIEVGFITNEEEEKKLIQEKFQNDIVMNICKAIVQYYSYN